MVNLISYPFRLGNTGAVETTEDGEDYYAEELACLIQTRPGERTLVPSYGITDPAFNVLSKTELIERVGMFGPPVTVTSINSIYIDETLVRTDVGYEPLDPGDIRDFNIFGEEDEEDQNNYDQTVNTDIYYDATEGN